MVFGNMGDDCGTGVAFSRNPATGENEIFGEFWVKYSSTNKFFIIG